jgi:hypothetical protein
VTPRRAWQPALSWPTVCSRAGTNVWTTLSSATTSSLAVQYGAAAFVDANQQIVFGGTSGGLPTNRLVRWSSTAAAQITTTGTTPAARTRSQAAYLPNCYGTGQPCLVAFGGLSAETGGSRLGDTVIADMRVSTTATWSSVSPIGAVPSARHSGSMVASHDGQYAYLFGGDSSTGVSNDVYMYAPFGFADPQPTEMTNIAVGKWTNMSSTSYLYAGQSSRAVDGVITTNLASLAGANNATAYPNNNRCTFTNATASETSTWWVVDLGAANTVIDAVTIYTRTDCCPGRLGGFQVYVSNVYDPTFATATRCPNPCTYCSLASCCRYSTTPVR